MSAAATSRQAFAPAAPYAMRIGDEWRAGTTSFDAVDPSTGEVWARIPQGTAADVADAVAAARAAFPAWRRTTPAARQELLWRIADRVEADPDRWARLLATENGRPIREAYVADVPTCAGIFRFFSGVVRELRGDQIPVEAPDRLVYTTREPLGVIAALIPWNSPIITLANKVAPALAAGNVVVVKPSEFASASVLEFARLVEDLLPPGVLNVVTGDGPETGAALVAHPDVAKITFTGGPETARRIMTAAGTVLTPSIMELGGKGAMIVCADADVERAVSDALTGIYLANGEACIAASRLLVHEAIHDDFLAEFERRARTIVVGDALDQRSQFGPMVSRGQRDRVEACVAAAVDEGAALRVGGVRPELGAPFDGGFFLEPTLLEEPAGATSASRSEIFGPVTVLERFRDDEDAIARANGTPYGLAAGVWTSDLARAHRIAQRLEVGISWVNTWFDLPIGAPMGGVKESGFGRETSAETLLEYSAPRVVNIDLGPTRPHLWGDA
ncbi:aldehyde dehydrogenase family protein [Patulibacter defluvii]|uniref:aldehyde dehydrogenase family protein n=1 Tax=Patulibacter defluvii TaxID=3095358 RepID=UPI002A75141D|nr:aldehyde dehydrogenase family protein [Patulibacter sp. DM4]